VSAPEPAAAALAAKKPSEVKPFVVGQASSLSAQELNRFRIHNEGIVRSVGARLSLFLRTEFAFDLEHLDAMELGRFASKAEPIDNYLLFQVERFPGTGVVGFPKPLALAIGDRMLGGRGFGANPDRELREVELALLNQAVLLALKEYFSKWSDSQDEAKVRIVGRETNIKLLAEDHPTAIVYILKVQAVIGDCFATVDIILPLEMMAQSIQKAMVSMAEAGSEAGNLAQEAIRWNPAYNDLTMRISALWSGLSITPREILQMRAGDMIPLDPAKIDEVELQIEGLPRFRGKLGSANRKVAIEITERLT
jgi:flagellar motor switch protein FliM